VKFCRYVARYGHSPRLPVAIFNERRRGLLVRVDFAEQRVRVARRR
jgi:hypothetical protein